jgi:hypothetical protein
LFWAAVDVRFVEGQQTILIDGVHLVDPAPRSGSDGVIHVLVRRHQHLARTWEQLTARRAVVRVLQLQLTRLIAQIRPIQDHDATVLQIVNPIACRDLSLEEAITRRLIVVIARRWRPVAIHNWLTLCDVLASALDRYLATLRGHGFRQENNHQRNEDSRDGDRDTANHHPFAALLAPTSFDFSSLLFDTSLP